MALEDVILSLPAGHRAAVADLKATNEDLRRKQFELETDLTFAKQRAAELESTLAGLSAPKVVVAAPANNLQDLISTLQQSHHSKVDAIRRKCSDEIRNLDDPNFDAYLTLQQSVSRNLRAMAKNFDFVDLVQVKESIATPGFAPTSPLQAPLVAELINHCDAVRQCTKDGRFCRMYYDPVKMDILRRMFDACKTVESRLVSTSHLQLPPQSVVFEPSPTAIIAETDGDPQPARSEESKCHFSAIEATGTVFNRATTELQELDEIFLSAQTLPHYLPEYESVLQELNQLTENLHRNEVILREGGQTQIETVQSQRAHLVDQGERQQAKVAALGKEYEDCFTQMDALLQRVEKIFNEEINVLEEYSETQKQISLCDRRVQELKKITQQELEKQQRELEGAKFASFLLNKSRDAYRRLYNNMEEGLRARRELCERTRNAAQEQIYSMAESFHTLLGKRSNADAVLLRQDQQHLETANRSLIGLVHSPPEMERQMEGIRALTVVIAATKARQASTIVDINTLRQTLTRFGTLQFLKRDTNFFSAFDDLEKTAKLKDKVDDFIQRAKFISEMMVEVSDPDSRQDYVVEQCLDALKHGVADGIELVALKGKIDELDEPYRLTAAPKLRRHRRLISHFLEELREGVNGLMQMEPTIELHVVGILEAIDSINSALTRNEEPIPDNVRQSVLPNTQRMVQESTTKSDRGAPLQHKASGIMFGTGASRSNSVALDSPSNESFGGNVMSRSALDKAPSFHEVEVERQPQTFARASQRLRITAESKRLTKPGNSIEMSNTTALGSHGFRAGSGVHKYVIRIGASCTRLLVGFADWNIPLDGYCNSLKYNGCYYLHLGNGTLWCPEQGIERKQYTYEAIGSSIDGLLSCIIDTNERTISFVWGDINLGVAFRNVNLGRSLYPAFEIFSNGCTFEFVNE